MRRAIGCVLACALGVLVAAALGCGSGDSPSASIPGSDSGGEASPANAKAEAARQLAAAEREAFLNPVVEVATNRGAFKLKLDRANAEKTVDNFLEYAASGFYNGTIFHQAEKGYIVAAGGYTEDLRRKPTRVPIRNEAHNGLRNQRGTIAMVRTPSSIHSATSQFLVNLADNANLDHQASRTARRYDLDGEEPAAPTGPDRYGYCVFGQVIEGWDTIEKIAALPVEENQHLKSVPSQPVVIQSVRRIK